MESTNIDGNHRGLAAGLQLIEAHHRSLSERYEGLGPKDLMQPQKKLIEIAEMSEQINTARFIFCVVAASFVEAVANLYLALKCDKALFAVLVRTNFEDKLVKLPRLFYPTFKLNLNLPPGSDLRRLIRIRNKIVHPKPFIKVDGTVLHHGNEVRWTSEDHAFFSRLGLLPKSLVENLASYDSSDAISKLVFMSGIESGWYVQKQNEPTSRS